MNFLAIARFGICLALLQGAATPAFSQVPRNANSDGPPPPPSKEPQELVNLRHQYSVKALGAARTLSDQFSNALLNLERELGAAGDYDQALAAQRRRLDITEAYKAAFGDSAIPNSISLLAADAKTFGVVYDKASDVLMGWRKPGVMATWEVPKISPGAYQVVVTYAVGNGEPPPHSLPPPPSPNGAPPATPPDFTAGGEFEFFEDTTLPGADLNRRTGTVESTKGWGTMATLQLEPLRLQRTSARFCLRATRIKGGGGLMLLKQVQLVPFLGGAPPDPVTVAPDTGDELTKIQQAHAQKVKAIAQPITDTYFTALTALEQSLTQQQDSEALASLALERTRVTKWLADPSAPSPARQNAFRSALSSAGLTVLAEDARFVPDATNSGDRFHVIHDGKDLPLRLIWVSCPPPTPDNKPALEFHAKYFGISPEDAVSLGKEAQDFVASLLTDKPLRVLTAGQKDQEQRFLAMVVPEGMEDLSTMLVENGLAAINPPPARKQPSKRYETAVLEALKEREEAAKQRPIPPGAWGYVTTPSSPNPPAK